MDSGMTHSATRSLKLFIYTGEDGMGEAKNSNKAAS